MTIIHAGIYGLMEKMLRWCLHAKFRALVLRAMGSGLGSNVRIGEVHLSGLWNGFRNLRMGDYSYIGERCFLDLTGNISIGERTSISPSCTIITHQDPGSMLKSRLSELFPREVGDTYIGDDCWVGAGSTLLCGVRVGSRVIIGAGSLVNIDIPDECIAYGSPVRIVEKIRFPASPEGIE